MSESKNKLQEILDDILQDKNTNLTPDNLKQGVTCLGIEGNLQEGIDTSDATATSNDLVEGKTAYVNGEKIEGSLVASSRYKTGFSKKITDETTGLGDTINLSYNSPNFNMLLNSTELIIPVLNTDLSEHIGITPEKIIEGNTILGVEGTGKTGEDLNEVLQTQDNIIAEQQEQINTLLDAFNNKTQSPAKPNIFVQENEPEIKDGIWLQANKQVDKIIIDKNVVESNTKDTINTFPTLPDTYLKNSNCIYTYNNIFYLFTSTAAYTYDTITNTFSEIENYDIGITTNKTVLVSRC